MPTALAFLIVVLVATGTALLFFFLKSKPATTSPSYSPSPFSPNPSKSRSPPLSPSKSPPPVPPGIPPPWLGYNVMPGAGYSIKCLQAILDKTAPVGSGRRLRIRNDLSSYLNPESGSQYWEKDLRQFLDANKDRVALYSCLEWADEGDLQVLAKMSYLTHLQANGGSFAGTPRSDNPTEDSLVELPDFDLLAYTRWLSRMDQVLDPKVVIVIPFKQFSSAPPGKTSTRDVMMGQVLSHCASLQRTSKRPFGVETTVYPFWNFASAKPDKQVLFASLDAFVKVASDCQAIFGFPGDLNPIVCESGWPQTCTPKNPQPANKQNAKEYWALVQQYPAPPKFVLYYWQFLDVDNGDGCGEAWGVVDRDSCEWI